MTAGDKVIYFRPHSKLRDVHDKIPGVVIKLTKSKVKLLLEDGKQVCVLPENVQIDAKRP